MLKLFQKTNSLTPGRFWPKVKYIQERLTNNLSRVVNFYRLKQRPVENNHPLVRFLNAFLIPSSLPETRWVDLANQQAPSLGYAVGFGSAVNPLKFQPGVFYGSNVKELVFVDTSRNYFDVINDAQRLQITDWRDLRPIRVLSHPKTDLSFHLVNKKQITDEAGYATLIIDVATLIVQFKKWQQHQLTIPPGERQSIGQFVGAYILPNMLYSHIDVAWMNRFNYHLLGLKPAPIRKLISIALPETMTYVDEVLLEMADTFNKRQFDMELLWHTAPLPVIKNSVFKDAFYLPKLPPTRYSKAFITVSTLSWVELLFAQDSIFDSSLNRKYYVELSIYLDSLISARIIDTIPGDVKDIKARIMQGLAAYVNK